MAETWLAAVIYRFRAGIMTNGCGRDGEPVDGPSFWPWENLWMLQFADALPKTRSGKIMRRILKVLASGGTDVGNTMTLADPTVVDTLMKERDRLMGSKKGEGG